LAQFAAFAVEDDPGKLMASFTAVELNEDAPPVRAPAASVRKFTLRTHFQAVLE